MPQNELSRSSKSRPVLFLDRDGVIVREVDGGAAQSPEALALMPEIVEVLKHARDYGYLLVVASNQPDFALGNITLARRDEIEHSFVKLLVSAGVALDRIYYCYHHENAVHPSLRVACGCRKPKPGLLFQAEQELSIDLASSYLLGDRASDIRAGVDAGVHTILLDPHGKQQAYLHEHKVQPEYRIRVLGEAISLLSEQRV